LAASAGEAEAGAELAAMASTLPVPREASSKDRRLQFHPMRDGHPEVRGLARFVWIAMAVVGTVLLIACFNVAALLLARAAERRREIGIRTALGASRARIVRQLVVEGLVLAGVSGAAALALAAWSGPLLAFFSLPAPIPQRMHLGVDGRLVGFTAAMVVIAGVLPGLLPALQATRRDIFLSMRLDAAAGGGRPSRSRNRLVAVPRDRAPLRPQFPQRQRVRSRLRRRAHDCRADGSGKLRHRRPSHSNLRAGAYRPSVRDAGPDRCGRQPCALPRGVPDRRDGLDQRARLRHGVLQDDHRLLGFSPALRGARR